MNEKAAMIIEYIRTDDIFNMHIGDIRKEYVVNDLVIVLFVSTEDMQLYLCIPNTDGRFDYFSIKELSYKINACTLAIDDKNADRIIKYSEDIMSENYKFKEIPHVFHDEEVCKSQRMNPEEMHKYIEERFNLLRQKYNIKKSGDVET